MDKDSSVSTIDDIRASSSSISCRSLDSIDNSDTQKQNDSGFPPYEESFSDFESADHNSIDLDDEPASNIEESAKINRCCKVNFIKVWKKIKEMEKKLRRQQ